MTSTLVLRNNKDFDDSSFLCLSNGIGSRNYRGSEGSAKAKYLVMTFRGDPRDQHVLSRKTCTREDAEAILNDASTRMNTYVDSRDDPTLCPLADTFRGAVHPMRDFAPFKSYKSDGEAQALMSLHDITRQALDETPYRSAGQWFGNSFAATFRSRTPAKHAVGFSTKEATGFTQYRGGFRDESGLCSDLSRIVPKNDDWEARMNRVHRGLAYIASNARPGMQVSTLDKMFHCFLDVNKDTCYGSCVSHSGWDGIDENAPLKKLEQGNFVTLCANVGDARTSEVADVLQGTLFIE
jgi:hypothetical protein